MEERYEEIEEKQSWFKGPVKYIAAVFLILMIILWIIPIYAIRMDPEPKNIPALADILPANIQPQENPPQDYKQLVNPTDQIIKQAADQIAAKSCSSSKICQAKAIYYFVRDNINYVSDPINKEYLEDPKEVLLTSAGDCESGAILLASMMEAIGIDAQLVFIPGHAFVRIKLDKAKAKYKIDDYIYLDWTCKQCTFGEIPYKNINKERQILEV
ncbi:transglutaminase-like domain-containing protein [Candidatus Woesearchaeota archaeon]|nr:transglutaminase-like domain-containing protein [Candidatus Woesearchaeota archaeon]